MAENKFVNDWNNDQKQSSESVKKETALNERFYAETTCITNIKNIVNDTKEIKSDGNQQFYF